MTVIRSTRDLILDAFETILLESGERTATLEAVARQASVSKGGLLYHFASKNDLVDGEIDRLRQLARDDFKKFEDAPDRVVARLLRSSVVDDTPFDNAFMAVTRLAQSRSFPAVTVALNDIEATWLELLTGALGDSVVARMVLLISDGLYYESALSPGSPAMRPEVDDLLVAIDQLITARSTALG